jgi:hypothetical protein
MNEQKRLQRRQQFRKLDAWLERLFQEHRVLFYLLAVAITVVVSGVVVLLEKLLKWVLQ